MANRWTDAEELALQVLLSKKEAVRASAYTGSSADVGGAVPGTMADSSKRQRDGMAYDEDEFAENSFSLVDDNVPDNPELQMRFWTGIPTRCVRKV
eukprot:s320_g27.t1